MSDETEYCPICFRDGSEIPKEELSQLRTKAEAYDKGHFEWVICRDDGSRTNSAGPTEDSAVERFAWYNRMTKGNVKIYMNDYGYTCRKVRVCKEVEG